MNKTLCAALAAGLLAPSFASADILTVWAAGKGEYLSGTGDVFKKFDSDLGYGVAAGVEVIGIDIWGDALIMGSDQFQFSANLGIDLSFGKDVRVTVGLFTGPMFLVFPEQEVQTLTLSDDVRTVLDSAGLDPDDLKSKYDKIAEEEAVASRLAAAWNLGRAQLTVEFKLAPMLYLGVGGQVGYHWVLTGEEAAADAKAGVVEDYAKQNGLTPEQTDLVRDSVGAEEIDKDNLDGLNYQAGAFLRLEL
jgi:hypothetical protein